MFIFIIFELPFSSVFDWVGLIKRRYRKNVDKKFRKILREGVKKTVKKRSG